MRTKKGDTHSQLINQGMHAPSRMCCGHARLVLSVEQYSQKCRPHSLHPSTEWRVMLSCAPSYWHDTDSLRSHLHTRCSLPAHVQACHFDAHALQCHPSCSMHMQVLHTCLHDVWVCFGYIVHFLKNLLPARQEK